MRWTALVALLVLGCDEGGDNATRSCAGQRVLECEPYEWATVTEASFTEEVALGDGRARPRVQVTLTSCGASTPSVPEVQIQVIVGESDAGGPARVVELTSVSAPSADATSIDLMIENPFTIGGGIPPEEDVSLRFTPIVGGCDGDALTIPYRTGPIFEP